MREPFTEEVRIKQKDLTVLIENLLEQEEIHWQQRGRANWLRHGDRNTTYYHNFASARKRKNLIKRLKDSNGDWVEGDRGLVPLISDYFSNLFTREVEEPHQALLDVVRPCVTPAMNTILTAPYTAEEVKKSLFQIGDMKAPGPDVTCHFLQAILAYLRG
jgi:UDP-2,3-diacylglucosamine pyrophosphatase LpxH